MRSEREREREGDRFAIVIRDFRYVGQISVSGRISLLIKWPILHFALPRRPEIASRDNEQVSRNIRAEICALAQGGTRKCAVRIFK